MTLNCGRSTEPGGIGGGWVLGGAWTPSCAGSSLTTFNTLARLQKKSVVPNAPFTISSCMITFHSFSRKAS
jgi:hypothetical protein